MPRKSSSTKRIDADVVTARAFVLVDEHGTDRAELSTYGGAVILNMLTKEGEPLLTLQVDSQNYPSVSLRRDGGQIAIGLSAGRDTTGIGIHDQDGVPAVQIGFSHDPAAVPVGDRPSVILMDPRGTKILTND